jgi:quinol-cytochrome oxidoreductase complex cytochrome b subunit
MAKKEGWLEERVELSKLAWLGTRTVPRGVGWWYTFGSATLIVFIILVLTGIFLMFNYDPSPDHAYDSVQFITNNILFGSLIRSIHHWSAYAMVGLVTIHALRVFFMAAYRYPREITWVFGVALLLLVMGMAFTGYLLPWDQRAYWATTVGTNIAGETPFIGGWIKTLLLGGEQIGAVTLTRFFALHVAIIPGLIATFIGVHLFLVIRLGISPPPGSTALACE